TRYYNQKFLKIAGSPTRNLLDEHLMAAFANAPKNVAPSDAAVTTKPNGHVETIHLSKGAGAGTN
ncbi:MAG TPA: hypothetical protein VH022_10020, partial [Candidatus Acidoferrum sp.]|nr:hypothetical protein [Candidatus Acidoferrum sp.]